MVKNRCRYAIVETTSEGIKQFRHRFINYDVLLFTSLYPEHIESHGSFDKYREAKGKLFAHIRYGAIKYVDTDHLVVRPKNAIKKLDLTRIPKTIIVNGDDDNANYFLNFWSEAKLVYSFNSETSREFFMKQLNSETTVSDFTCVKGSDINLSARGISFKINEQPINLQILGKFNAANAAAAYAVGLNQGFSVESIKFGIEQVKSLAGKLEKVDVGQNFTVMIDYSFEPRALEKLYETVQIIPHQRILHVIGSTGGGRDKSRRPELGIIAAKNADIVIVTNEDPYDEDPAEIITQVAHGAQQAGKTPNNDLFKIMDRGEAIKMAINLAQPGDLVLITGKGAEQYICVSGGSKIPWDDREATRAALVEKLQVDKG